GLKQELAAATVFVVAAPQTNAGGFRGFFAAAPFGKNDYTGGFTLDLGPFASPRWQALNVEGAGFGRYANLLGGEPDLGRLHRFCVVLGDGPGGIRLFFDGNPAGKRDRAAGTLGLDHVFVGARCYSNEARPPFAQGFLDGAVAEVLVFDKALADE